MLEAWSSSGYVQPASWRSLTSVLYIGSSRPEYLVQSSLCQCYRKHVYRNSAPETPVPDENNLNTCPQAIWVSQSSRVPLHHIVSVTPRICPCIV